MESLRNEEQRRVLMGFFKTGPGEYGEGDEFLGLKVPQTREVVKLALTIDHGPLTINHGPLTINHGPLTIGPEPLTIDEVPELLMSKWHEVRLCGLLILVAKFEKLAAKRLVNNWDLVDLSAPKILGAWIKTPSCPSAKGNDPMQIEYKRQILDDLAASDNLWKQRMSIVCTWKTSQMGDPSWCLRYAEIHLHHPHDLMHKAVGWMLREMGKRCSMDLLRDFLRQHAHEMPRTMLRYAIEKMSEKERKEWMAVEV